MSEEYREPREPVPSTRSSRDPSQLPETPEAPVPPPPTKRVGQRIWLKALLLIGIFVSGAVVGGGVAVVSIVRKIPPIRILPQVLDVCGHVVYAPYALPGSREVRPEFLSLDSLVPEKALQLLNPIPQALELGARSFFLVGIHVLLPFLLVVRYGTNDKFFHI